MSKTASRSRGARRRRLRHSTHALAAALVLCALDAGLALGAPARAPRTPSARAASSAAVSTSAAPAAPASSAPGSQAGSSPSSPASPGASSPAGPATPPEPPTRLLSGPPAAVADGTRPLVVSVDATLWQGSQMPSLVPAAAGRWTMAGSSYVFTPTSTLAPCSAYTVIVWPKTIAAAHAPLGKRRTLHFSVDCPPMAGLQQALARLGFLGARLHTSRRIHERAGALTRAAAALSVFRPPRGPLVPDPAGAPPVHVGQLDASTRGALTVYQGERGLPVTGEPNRDTWESLLHDLTFYRRDPVPYTWVTVSESLPETLRVHRGTRTAFTTPVNTGVAGAETQQGIFPIYARYVSTSMSGTDPDGVSYDVPDVPWVNYFNGGDAVHGYPRASYGWPQSNGCVELPIENARLVFGMLTLGDIVWVS